MGFIKKRKTTTTMARDNRDLFSLLPESLLLAIISFLPFKEAAARTCTLSKKWLRIWQSGDNIDFNENLFVDSTSDEIKESQRDLFMSFITHWIEHFTNRNINKFSLKVMNPRAYWDTIESCIAFATQRGVKDLALDFSDPKWDKSNNIYDHHGALFYLTTHVNQLGSPLESLKLYSCDFGIYDFSNFSALKDVSLGWIEVRIYVLKTLLSTCKTIESLSLERCWNIVELDLEDIVQLGLKRLVLHKCDTQIIILDAPNLKYFKFCGVVFRSEICVSPNVIEEVDIDFSIEPEYYRLHASRLCQILIDFKDAKILTVCSYLLQVVPFGEDPVSTISFLNVRHLILKTQMHKIEFCGIEFLLNSCPLLEKLTLDIDQRVIYEDEYIPRPAYDVDLLDYWQVYRALPECLVKTLKVVEVIGSRMTDDELKALHFLVSAGKVLEQLNINLCNKYDGHGCAQLLVRAQKASENLQILIWTQSLDGPFYF